jgi:hypothetical protein
VALVRPNRRNRPDWHTKGNPGGAPRRAGWWRSVGTSLVSAVLAVLCLEEALAHVVRKGDDADGDVVVMECAGCPGAHAGQEQGCGQRDAQAQDELRPRVDGRGYPGQMVAGLSSSPLRIASTAGRRAAPGIYGGPDRAM